MDQRPDGLQQYLANAVYESCRSQQLKLKAFPDFSQYIQSLKDVKPESTGHEYQLCTKRGTTLCVLGSYASKWLESEQFKEEATAIIQQHNQQYNPEGDFVEEAQDRTCVLKKNGLPKYSTYFSSIVLFSLLPPGTVIDEPHYPSLQDRRSQPRTSSQKNQVGIR